MPHPEQAPPLINDHLSNIALGFRIQAMMAYPQIGTLFGDQDRHDPYTGPHADRVTLLAYKSLRIIQSQNPDLGIDEHDFTDLITSGLMHDIGKIRAPVEFDHHLTEEEISIVRPVHTYFTRRLLTAECFPPRIKQIVMSHHDIIRSAPGFKCGQPYPRYHDIPFSGKDKRTPLDPKTELLAKVLWFTDKFDRMVNGYGGYKPLSFREILDSYQSNFDPNVLEENQFYVPILLSAARDTFFEPQYYEDFLSRPIITTPTYQANQAV